MEISSTLAQTIVYDMKKIINQELNFMDTDGLVIASTDPERINTYHEGAKKVITTKEDLIIEDNEQFIGTKKGINIPIYFENKIIGVIGITGEKEEVAKYGQIIRKMTEILIKDAWLKDLSIQRRENHRTLIDYLLFSSDFDEKKSDFPLLFEMNLMTPKHVVVGTIIETTPSSYNVIEGMNIIFEKFFLSNQQNIFSIKNDEMILIVDHTFENDLKYTLESIVKDAAANLHTTLMFGIGLSTSNRISFKQSYHQAKTAINWGKVYSSQKIIHYYNDLDLGLVLSNISFENKNYYINKVLSNLSQKEIDEYYEILKVYGDNNGSINKSAEDLFIHKNTLQYKLNKLASITGYNPRIINEYVILRIAFLLNQST